MVGRVSAILVLCCVGGQVRASPPLELVTEGACPDAEQLREAGLDDQGSSSWVLRVEGSRRQVKLSLTDPSGQLALERELESPDCAARARAIAIIIRAHFVKLAAQTPETPAPETEPRAHPVSVKIRSRTRSTREPRRRRLDLVTAISGGLSVAPDPRLVSALGQLEIGFRPAESRFLGRVVVSMASPTTQDATDDRVRVRQYGFRLDGALRWSGERGWLQPALGAGVELLDVTALDLSPDRSVRRVHLVAALALAAGYRVGGGLSLRAETTLLLSPWSDRYVIGAVGEVGRSPWACLLFLVGLQLETKVL
jgi:hypothetical protein